MYLYPTPDLFVVSVDCSIPTVKSNSQPFVDLGKKLVQRAWKNITHLVIDEISMIDAHFFTCLEYVSMFLTPFNSFFFEGDF